MTEPFLEPLLRQFRIGRVIKEIRNVPNCRLLDIGCGFNYRFLQAVEPYIEYGLGIDFKVPPTVEGKIETIQTSLDSSLPSEDGKFDIVTMLAVLEHLAKPVDICKEICRVLKPNGRLVLTVPGKLAKPVLEFLSFRLGLVSRDEIEDHKKYYDLPELNALFDQVDGLQIERHQHFQLGMNNFCVITKIDKS